MGLALDVFKGFRRRKASVTLPQSLLNWFQQNNIKVNITDPSPDVFDGMTAGWASGSSVEILVGKGASHDDVVATALHEAAHFIHFGRGLPQEPIYKMETEVSEIALHELAPSLGITVTPEMWTAMNETVAHYRGTRWGAKTAGWMREEDFGDGFSFSWHDLETWGRIRYRDPTTKKLVIAGSVTWSEENRNKGEPYIHIWSLEVRPEYRMKGMATKVLEWLRQRYPGQYLSANPVNPVLAPTLTRLNQGLTVQEMWGAKTALRPDVLDMVGIIGVEYEPIHETVSADGLVPPRLVEFLRENRLYVNAIRYTPAVWKEILPNHHRLGLTVNAFYRWGTNSISLQFVEGATAGDITSSVLHEVGHYIQRIRAEDPLDPRVFDKGQRYLFEGDAWNIAMALAQHLGIPITKAMLDKAQRCHKTYAKRGVEAMASDYHVQHRPPDDGDPLWDLGSAGIFPADVYDHPEWYQSGEYLHEAARVIHAVRGKPDALVTIYRAAPPGITAINTGDWVTTVESYARLHGMDRVDSTKDWPVMSAQVAAKHVRNGGNDLVEWGYWGPPTTGRVASMKEAAKTAMAVPHDQLPADLRSWIDEFKRQPQAQKWQTQEGAQFACVDASMEFARFLKGKGVEYATAEQLFRYLGPDTTSFYSAHCVNVVLSEEGYYWVDWTQRQYDPGADWPLVYTDEDAHPGGFEEARPVFASMKEAAYDDVRAKAARIRRNGGVSVTRIDRDVITGTIRGDHGTYDVVLYRQDPDSYSISLWECTCPWRQYAFGRSPNWEHLEGRQCSHALALLYEVQSRWPRGPGGKWETWEAKVAARGGRFWHLSESSSLHLDPERDVRGGQGGSVGTGLYVTTNPELWAYLWRGKVPGTSAFAIELDLSGLVPGVDYYQIDDLGTPPREQYRVDPAAFDKVKVVRSVDIDTAINEARREGHSMVMVGRAEGKTHIIDHRSGWGFKGTLCGEQAEAPFEFGNPQWARQRVSCGKCPSKKVQSSVSGPIYRGYNVRFPVELERDIRRLLESPMEESEVGQHKQIGDLILDWLKAGVHYDSRLSLGRHWTTRRSMAETAAFVGGGWGVILEATYDPSGVDPDFTLTTPGAAAFESEVTLLPGARVTVTGVYLTDQDKNENLLEGPRQMQASAEQDNQNDDEDERTEPDVHGSIVPREGLRKQASESFSTVVEVETTSEEEAIATALDRVKRAFSVSGVEPPNLVGRVVKRYKADPRNFIRRYDVEVSVEKHGKKQAELRQDKMWHVAGVSQRESIRERGLDHSVGIAEWRQALDPEEASRYPVGNYLWKTYEAALHAGSVRDIWEVDTRGYALHPDPGLQEGWEAGLAFYATEPIGPERLRLVRPGGHHAKTAATIETTNDIPLDYKGMFPGSPQRFMIHEQGASTSTDHTYYAGLPETVVGFLDCFVEPDRVWLAYVHVRFGYNGKGYARQLIQKAYDTFPTQSMEWGKIAHQNTWTLFKSFKERYPDRTYGKNWGRYSSKTSMAMGGNCYEAALETMMEFHEQGTKDAILVHGIAVGRGPIEGVVFGHGWVELNNIVFDNSNGQNVVMPKDRYYELGQISYTVRYTFQEMAKHAVDTGNSGPWDPKILRARHAKTSKTYWHLTKDPNFKYDPNHIPRSGWPFHEFGEESRGYLHITSDPNYWLNLVGWVEPDYYAAEIDISGLTPGVDYVPDQENSITPYLIIKNPEKVRVKRIVSIEQALIESTGYDLKGRFHAKADSEFIASLTFDYMSDADFADERPFVTHRIQAWGPDGDDVGRIEWHVYPEGRAVGYLTKVEEPYRRQGVATELWRRAREKTPGLVPGEAITPEGEGFSKTLRNAKRGTFWHITRTPEFIDDWHWHLEQERLPNGGVVYLTDQESLPNWAGSWWVEGRDWAVEVEADGAVETEISEPGQREWVADVRKCRPIRVVPLSDVFKTAKRGSGVMYHVTKREHRDSIRIHGLNPDKSEIWERKNYMWTWLFDSRPKALALAQANARLYDIYGAGVDIWTVDVSGLELQEDPHGPYPHSWATKDTIPPSRLLKVEGFESITEPMPGRLDWEERLSKFSPSPVHEGLYPPLFGEDIYVIPQVKERIISHLFTALYRQWDHPHDWVHLSLFGSGVSYNWDEGGDLDIQVWVDPLAHLVEEGAIESETALLQSIREAIATINFVPLRMLGITGAEMTVQYYAKLGKGTEDEVLGQQPYAAYDLTRNEWVVFPIPLTEEFYEELFDAVESKAQALRAEAVALIEAHETVADEKQKQELKEGLRRLFTYLRKGRQEAYTPSGKGLLDERDTLWKMFEGWGLIDRLKESMGG